jgi:hypothetical protein
MRRFKGKDLGLNPLAWMRQTWWNLVAAFDAREPAFPSSKGRFIVVLIPWLGTTIPRYSHEGVRLTVRLLPQNVPFDYLNHMACPR